MYLSQALEIPGIGTVGPGWFDNNTMEEKTDLTIVIPENYNLINLDDLNDFNVFLKGNSHANLSWQKVGIPSNGNNNDVLTKVVTYEYHGTPIDLSTLEHLYVNPNANLEQIKQIQLQNDTYTIAKGQNDMGYNILDVHLQTPDVPENTLWMFQYNNLGGELIATPIFINFTMML